VKQPSRLSLARRAMCQIHSHRITPLSPSAKRQARCLSHLAGCTGTRSQPDRERWMMAADHEPTQARHVDLILRQIETLPTLPVLATRLLALTSSDQSSAREVIELIKHDQALTARVLSLCRKAYRGVNDDVLTVDKAVVLLGFNTIRNTVLSIKVVELFDDHERRAGGGSVHRPNGGLPRLDFWRHSLAVGIAAEMIAAAHPGRGLDPAEAFVAGLLHDIGKLALDHVLPRSYARVVELATLHQGEMAEFERRVIGMDHHTAGKRLAEQWRLPLMLQDCIWLHGTPIEALPRVEHQRMIALIGLANLIARQQHVGYSGSNVLGQDIRALATAIDLNPTAVQDCAARLHEQVQQRSAVLGVENEPTQQVFLESIQRANEALGRLNNALERRSRAAQQQARMLEAIPTFHTAAANASNVQEVLEAVVASANAVLGQGFYAVLYQDRYLEDRSTAWIIGQYEEPTQTLRCQVIEPPPHMPDLAKLVADQAMSMSLMGVLPWIADALVAAPDLRTVKLLPLSCGYGAAAVLLHDRANLPPWNQLAALTSTWGAAVAGASRHEGALRMGEELAEANRALAAAKDRLLHTESMARLGEMAAGAAHEMNNPLAIISGRSQLLVMSLPPGTEQHKAASTIFEQAHRLSDLISAMHLFADPPRPNRVLVDMGALLDETVRGVRNRLSQREADVAIDLQIKNRLPQIAVDPDQIADVVTQLLMNAIQASPRSSVTVIARVDRATQRLLVQVIDDGVGMDAHTLAHAMDPFFSAKPAGRRCGIGLTRAQKLASTNGGWIELRSTLNEGTVASLWLPLNHAQTEQPAESSGDRLRLAANPIPA